MVQLFSAVEFIVTLFCNKSVNDFSSGLKL